MNWPGGSRRKRNTAPWSSNTRSEPRVSGGQLAMLEEILGPLAGWSTTWAESGGLVMNARRDPGPEG